MSVDLSPSPVRHPPDCHDQIPVDGDVGRTGSCRARPVDDRPAANYQVMHEFPLFECTAYFCLDDLFHEATGGEGPRVRCAGVHDRRFLDMSNLKLDERAVCRLGTGLTAIFVVMTVWDLVIQRTQKTPQNVMPTDGHGRSLTFSEFHRAVQRFQPQTAEGDP